jgi:hypothetical protein
MEVILDVVFRSVANKLDRDRFAKVRDEHALPNRVLTAAIGSIHDKYQL